MNDSDLRPILHALSDEAQPVQADLWPAIRARLAKRPTPVRWTRPDLRRLAGAATLLLVLAAVTTAVMQGIIDLDPGLRGQRAVDLVTPLDLTESRNDLSVTLHWAYADGNRLALNYTITDARQPADPLPYRGGDSLPRLRDVQRQPFDPLQLIHADDSVPGALTMTVFYDTRAVAAGTETLALNAWLGLGRDSFSFDFSVPFRPPQLVSTPLSVSASGHTATLEDLRVTDTMITFEVCYDAPQDGQFWWPALRLVFDGSRMDGPPDSRYASHVQRDGDLTCYSGGWFLAVDAPPETIRLEVPYLSTPWQWTRENLAYIVEAWAELGVRAEIVPDVNGVTLSFPDGLPDDLDADVYDAAFEAAVARMPDHGGSQRITGPWVFTLMP